MANGYEWHYYLSSVLSTLIIWSISLVAYSILHPLDVSQSDIIATPTDNSGFGSFVFLLLVYLLIASITFILIFRFLRRERIRVFYALITGLGLFILMYDIFLSIQYTPTHGIEYYGLIGLEVILILFGVLYTYLYMVGAAHLGIRNLGIYLVALGMGRVLAYSFDVIPLIVLSIIIGIFDIYSVFKGPTGKIMGRPKMLAEFQYPPSQQQLDFIKHAIPQSGMPVIITKDAMVIGIGDIVYFTFLINAALVQFGWIASGVTMLLIIIGTIGTAFLLKRISPLPGLPLPIFMVLIGYAIWQYLLA